MLEVTEIHVELSLRGSWERTASRRGGVLLSHICCTVHNQSLFELVFSLLIPGHFSGR